MTAQEEFDKAYITSSEICKELGVTRATIVRKRQLGMLPDPVMINGAQIIIWKRVTIAPFLALMKIAGSRKGPISNGI